MLASQHNILGKYVGWARHWEFGDQLLLMTPFGGSTKKILFDIISESVKTCFYWEKILYNFTIKTHIYKISQIKIVRNNFHILPNFFLKK